MLLYKKLHHSLSREERAVFDRWYSASPRHREYFRRMKMHYRNNGRPDIDLEASSKILMRKLKFR